MPKRGPRVERSEWSVIPFMPSGIGPSGYSTKVSRGGRSVERSGWSRSEADRKAGRDWSKKKK